MSQFEYSDQEIGNREILILLPSFIHGVVMLTLARTLDSKVYPMDGLIALTAGGVITVFFGWLCGKLASAFPGMTFLDYAAQIVSKPVAACLTFIFGIHFLLIVAFEVSAVGEITQVYLLPKTPIEISSLAFLLVVIYGVCGSRVGLIRLNVLFFPIYFMILVASHLFVADSFELGNLKPFKVPDWNGLLKATPQAVLFFTGFETLLLYTKFVNKPIKVPRAAVWGMVLTVSIAMFSYFLISGVMGRDTPAQLAYPTIELMKEAQIPGGIIERSDILFFIIWMMTIFNTGAMAFDAALLAVTPLFPKMNKRYAVYLLSPLVFIISTLPRTMKEVFNIVLVDTFLQVPLAFALPLVLLMVAKWKGLLPKEAG